MHMEMQAMLTLTQHVYFCYSEVWIDRRPGYSSIGHIQCSRWPLGEQRLLAWLLSTAHINVREWAQRVSQVPPRVTS